MSRSKTRGRLFRPRRRSFAHSVTFPRWMLAAEIVLIGGMFWLARLSNGSERLAAPGLGSVLYFTLVLAIAAWVAFAGPTKPSSP